MALQVALAQKRTDVLVPGYQVIGYIALIEAVAGRSQFLLAAARRLLLALHHLAQRRRQFGMPPTLAGIQQSQGWRHHLCKTPGSV